MNVIKMTPFAPALTSEKAPAKVLRVFMNIKEYNDDAPIGIMATSMQEINVNIFPTSFLVTILENMERVMIVVMPPNIWIPDAAPK